MSGKKIKTNNAISKKNSKTTADFDKMIKVIFFNSFGFFYYLFLLSYIPAKYFNASGLQIGLIFSINIIGYLISSIIIGLLSDKYGNQKKLFVSIGSFGRGFALLFMYLAINFKSIEFFTGAIFFQGLIVMFFWTPLDMLISEKSDKEYRTIAFAKKEYLIGIGSFVGTLLAFGILGFSTYLFPQIIWLFYSPLVIFALCNIYAGIKFHFDVTDDVKEILDLGHNNTQKIKRGQKKNKRVITGFILLLIVMGLISINNTFANPFLQAYLIENIVQDPMIIMLIYFPAHIFAKMLAPKLGRFSLHVNIYFAITIICVFGAISTWMVISTTSGLVFSVVLLLDSLFVTAEEIIMKDYSSKISKKHRGKIFSALSFIKFSGAIVAPMIGGLFWDNFGHKIPFQITIIVEIVLITPYLLAIYFIIPKKNENMKVIGKITDNNLKIEKTINV